MSCITTLAGGAKLYTDISELHIHDWYTEVKDRQSSAFLNKNVHSMFVYNIY